MKSGEGFYDYSESKKAEKNFQTICKVNEESRKKFFPIFELSNIKEMKLPKFLLADNSDFPEDLFVVHTEYPRFILNVEEEEVEWLDDLEGDDEEQVAEEATKVVEEAFKWCDAELEKYDDEDEA